MSFLYLQAVLPTGGVACMLTREQIVQCFLFLRGLSLYFGIWKGYYLVFLLLNYFRKYLIKMYSDSASQARCGVHANQRAC